jgi:hypothetical protein
MSDRQELPQRRSVVGQPAPRERTIRILSECFAKNILEMEEFERVVTVPESLPVQLEVVPILGEVKEGRRVKTALPRKGPGVRVTGFVMMGDVKVRTR